VGRVVLSSPWPTATLATEEALSDEELVRVTLAARQIGGAFGGIAELLALTRQWRETPGKPAAKIVQNEIDTCVWSAERGPEWVQNLPFQAVGANVRNRRMSV